MSKQKKSNQVAVAEQTPFEIASKLVKDVRNDQHCSGTLWGCASTILGGAAVFSFLHPEFAVTAFKVCLLPIIGLAVAGVYYAKKATRHENELKQIMQQQFTKG